ncbi:MAG: hypothetical protein A2Z47_07070 [Thermodesulfovibrio sp. RBG_19FT_COMBO_42_12]|nr:MAG: hypothetical protein A2Z47_07070 [Thermodesulfovibrio sp. RBG_19FT_COMBO_42_12]
MNQIWLGLIAIAVVVTAGFVISLMIEMKKMISSLREFLKTTQETIKLTLEELQQTLKSIRNVSDNINDVTDDIKKLSGSVRNMGDNVSRVSKLIEGMTLSTVIKASGLKVGIMTALDILLNNLFSKKGGGK